MPGNILDLLITIPVYNEVQRIAFVKQFSSQLVASLGQTEADVAVLFVDDGSHDDTPHIIEQWVETLKTTHKGLLIGFVRLPKNTKKSGMYQTAINHQNANYYLFVDADGSFQVRDIFRCFHLSQRCDVVITHKSPTHDRHFVRRLTTLAHNKITRIIFAGTIDDTQTGLKLFSYRAAQLTFPCIYPWHGFASDFVLIYEAYQRGLQIVQTSVTSIHRDGSHVQLLRDGLRYLFVVVFVILFRGVHMRNTTTIQAE